MALAGLRVHGFRNIHDATLQFESRRIGISGENGSGKTSLLEAIYFVANGRSFRASSPRKLLQHGCKEGFRVDCLYTNPAGKTNNQISARYNTHSLAFSLNGVSLGTRSELSKIMPCRYLGPRVHDLVTGPPKLRRAFLDWGLFHVKHIPLTLWRRYKKSVQLRIASMRCSHPARVIDGIEIDIVRSGLEIAEHRRRYCESLDFGDVNTRTDLQLAFEYRDAFDSEERAISLLHSNRKRDMALGYQTVGPHRADLVIRQTGRVAREQLSGGQSKLLAMSLLLAQFEKLSDRDGPVGILLVDDMAAELGKANRKRIFEQLESSGAQVFFTATDNNEKHPEMFHVEHGNLGPVL